MSRVSPGDMQKRTPLSTLFTVIVPSYNRSQLLRRLLDALCRQTLDSHCFEVVVIDDGSVDDTPQMLADFPQPRPGWMRSQRQANRGPAAARNRAIGLATAPWVVMTDDDTLPDPGWLQAISRGIDEHPDWVGLEGMTVCPDPDPLGHWVENLRGGQYITANMAYRLDLLRDLGGFDETFPHPKCEDTELAWRCLARGPIGFYPPMLIVHPNRPQAWRSALSSARYELSEFRLAAKLGSDYGKFRRIGRPWLMIALIYGVVPWFRAWRFRKWLLSHPGRALSYALLHLLRPLSFLYYWGQSA